MKSPIIQLVSTDLISPLLVGNGIAILLSEYLDMPMIHVDTNLEMQRDYYKQGAFNQDGDIENYVDRRVLFNPDYYIEQAVTMITEVLETRNCHLLVSGTRPSIERIQERSDSIIGDKTDFWMTSITSFNYSNPLTMISENTKEILTMWHEGGMIAKQVSFDTATYGSMIDGTNS